MGVTIQTKPCCISKKLKFSLKKAVSLSRGHVVGKTHLKFAFNKGGLNHRARRMQSSLLELLRRSR